MIKLFRRDLDRTELPLLAEQIGGDEAAVRAVMVMAQLTGFAIVYYALRPEAFANARGEELVDPPVRGPRRLYRVRPRRYGSRSLSRGRWTGGQARSGCSSSLLYCRLPRTCHNVFSSHPFSDHASIALVDLRIPVKRHVRSRRAMAFPEDHGALIRVRRDGGHPAACSEAVRPAPEPNRQGNDGPLIRARPGPLDGRLRREPPEATAGCCPDRPGRGARCRTYPPIHYRSWPRH